MRRTQEDTSNYVANLGNEDSAERIESSSFSVSSLFSSFGGPETALPIPIRETFVMTKVFGDAANSGRPIKPPDNGGHRRGVAINLGQIGEI